MTLRCGASLAALVAAAVLAAGCGEEKPADVARSYVATNKPAKCDLLTQGLLEQLTGRQGGSARAACRRNVVRFPAPKDVRVRGGAEEQGEEGEEAGETEVQLVVDGHPADVKLVHRGEQWLIAGMGD
jgi:hypothetical protein